jgi:hypothetical protein
MLAGTKMILDFMTLIVQALEKRNATSRGKGLCMGFPFLPLFSSSLSEPSISSCYCRFLSRLWTG